MTRRLRAVLMFVAAFVLLAVVCARPVERATPSRVGPMAAPDVSVELETGEARPDVLGSTTTKDAWSASRHKRAAKAPALPSGSVVAAPEGTPAGTGTASDPLDLKTALSAGSPVRPGGSVFLRGGTYTGTFRSDLAGTETQRIVVRSFPTEWAVLDGSTNRGSTLDVQGRDVTFRDFEVTKSDPVRTSGQPSNTPTDLSRSNSAGVWVQGVRAKLINLVIHDNAEGVGLWRRSQSAEVYGCIIFNNGWLGSDHGWGHGIYTQNDRGPKKTITDNVIFNNFGYGVHAYDKSGQIVGIEIEGNTTFENGSPTGRRHANVLTGAVTGATDLIEVRENVLYHRPDVSAHNGFFGYPPIPGVVAARGSFLAERNLFIGGSRPLSVRGWRQTTLRDNLVFARPGVGGEVSYVAAFTPYNRLDGNDGTDVWDGNVYRDSNIGRSTAPSSFGITERGRTRSVTFDDWVNSTGFDGATDYRTGSPTEQRVMIRPNRYETGRGTITVLDWTGKRSVRIDLSKVGLKKGHRFEIRDVQDVLGEPVLKGKYKGGTVTIPLTGKTIQQPIGNVPSPVSHTPSEFNSFLVLPR